MGGVEGWRDLGREDRVAQAADIHITLFCLPQIIRLQLSVASFLCRDHPLILTLIQPRQQLRPFFTPSYHPVEEKEPGMLSSR